MAITVLAVAFLLLLLALAFGGYRILTQKTESLKETNQGQCTICRNSFEKSKLIERQIGDYKILYFCRQCIEKLYDDMKSVD